MNEVFDVIIPVATKDLNFIHWVVKYIRKNICGASYIYIITNKKNISLLNNKVLYDAKLKVLDEDSVTGGLSFNSVQEWLLKADESFKTLTGWYFQQILKYAFALSKYSGKYYLSWDADTLPLNKIQFFKDGKPLFTKKNEYHEPYFHTMYRLLGYGRLVDYSFIAEHMLFHTEIVKELISQISDSEVNGNNWMEKIINGCDYSENSKNLFSEFETYGNFCIKNHPDLYELQKLNTFRAAGMIRGRYITENILKKLSWDIDTASFEIRDAIFPYNLLCNLGRIKQKILLHFI